MEWAKKFLMNFLSIEKQSKQCRYKDTDNNGPYLWMCIMRANQSESASAMRRLVKDLEKISVRDFPEEDVRDCTDKISEICWRLFSNDKLPDDVESTICACLGEFSDKTFKKHLTLSEFGLI